ncbi:hypothetical protein LSAT2_018324 [Lamellibrachia satsuma]|nr:hypothetical protein LSAT2_018324 [Lamellibrachia satsuma]
MQTKHGRKDEMAAFRFVKSLTKLVIGAGAVYVTVEEGVWSTSRNSCKALDRVRTSVLPATSEYINQAPSVSEFHNTLVTKWNYGVEKTFGCIMELPPDLFSRAAEYCKKGLSELARILKP